MLQEALQEHLQVTLLQGSRADFDALPISKLLLLRLLRTRGGAPFGLALALVVRRDVNRKPGRMAQEVAGIEPDAVLVWVRVTLLGAA